MNRQPPLSIAVYGAGAVGGYLASKLAALGSQPPRVSLVARPTVAEAIDRHGLVVREFGREGSTQLPAVGLARELEPQDLVLLTVRTYDVPAAIDDLRWLLGDQGILVAFQNGVGTESLLASSFGVHRVLAGTLTVSVGMEQPGVIARYSRGGGIALAAMDDNHVPARVTNLFASTGLSTVTLPDWRSLRWSKLLLNMIAAATSAILDMDIDRIVDDPVVFRVEQLAFREATAVTDAQGIVTSALPGYDVPRARMAMRLPRPLAQRLLGRRIASARSGRSPAMRADMARGRTEVAEYNGAIAAAGKHTGVPTPVNQALTALTLQLVAEPQRRDRFRENPAALVQYLSGRDIRI